MVGTKQTNMKLKLKQEYKLKIFCTRWRTFDFSYTITNIWPIQFSRKAFHTCSVVCFFALRLHEHKESQILFVTYKLLEIIMIFKMLEWLVISAYSKGISVLSVINPLKTKRRLLYLRPSSYRAVNTFHLGYKNQSVYDVRGHKSLFVLR